MLYGGRTAAGDGHSFICDGYSDGYYHINWGWGGISDGYYLLPVLNPTQQGIGGASDAYAFGQTMVIGIQKPQPGSVERISLVVNGFLFTNKDSYHQGDDVRFGFFDMNSMAQVTENGSVCNYSYFDINVYPAVKLTDADGTVKYMRSDMVASLKGAGAAHIMDTGLIMSRSTIWLMAGIW